MNARTTTPLDYDAEIVALVATLRTRDNDPTYADAPVLDSYARISRKSTRAVDEKTNVQTWRNLTRITREHARLGEVLVDEARSAWKRDGARPAWDRLVTRCGSGESNGVVARFVDRLARQGWDIEQLIRVGETRAYRVVTDADTYRFDNWREVERLTGEVRAAQRDSSIKSEKIRDQVEVRLSAGDDRNGPSPFGHRWDNEVDDVQLDAERDALRWGIRHVLDGGSFGQVAKEWTRRGLVTRRGVAFHPLNVRAALILPRHAGIVSHLGVRVGQRDDAVVTVAEHVRLMVLLGGRKTGRQPGESAHCLSSVLRCDGCGRGMVGSTDRGTYADGTPKRIYRCPPAGCGKCSVDARAAEMWAGRAVVRALSAPEHAAGLARQRSAVAELDARIGEYVAAIDRQETLRKGVHFTRRDRYDDRIAELDTELAPLLDERAALVLSPAGTGATDPDTLAVEWNGASPAERRVLAQKAMPGGFWCAPVGRHLWLRGTDILSRFSAERGGATPCRSDVATALDARVAA